MVMSGQRFGFVGLGTLLGAILVSACTGLVETGIDVMAPAQAPHFHFSPIGLGAPVKRFIVIAESGGAWDDTHPVWELRPSEGEDFLRDLYYGEQPKGDISSPALALHPGTHYMAMIDGHVTGGTVEFVVVDMEGLKRVQVLGAALNAPRH
jgi:hypothetical protein